MELTLVGIQYNPNADPVALLIKHQLGSFFISTTQSTLQTYAIGDAPWSDAEALIEAQAGVDRMFPNEGYVVVLPKEKPAPGLVQPVLASAQPPLAPEQPSLVHVQTHLAPVEEKKG